jgi:hypothetical protein
MARLVRLWTAAKEGDLGPLRKVIKWSNTGVAYAEGQHRMTIASINHQPDLIARFRSGELSKPAMHVVQSGINEQLKGRISPRLLWDDTGRLALHHVPADLLSAMWLQFALAVDGDRQYTQCEDCRKWFAVATPGAGRKDKQFCSSACRARKWRQDRLEKEGK